MQVQAKAKYIHMSPRKTRLVVDLVRGLPIEEARRQLLFSKKAAAKPVLKALNSAIANAENNFNQDTSKFKVVEAYVDEGPTFHRFRPRAHGRATPIRHRMSHIVIAVGDGQAEKQSVERKEVKPKVKKTVKPAAKKVANKKVVKKKATQPAKTKKSEAKS